MKHKLVAHHHVFIVIGNFNPSIFQPFWLVNKKLVGERESQILETNPQNKILVHNEITRLTYDWFELEVTAERFMLRCTQEAYFENVRDFLVNVFTLLSHTPIKSAGINHLLFYEFESRDDRDAFAWFVSPRNVWENVMSDPRLVKCEYLEKKPDSRNYFRVSLEQSELNIEQGCKFAINQHFDFRDSQNSAFELVESVNEHWVNTFNRAVEVAPTLVKSFVGQQDIQ